LRPLRPERSASTNSTTSAWTGNVPEADTQVNAESSFFKDVMTKPTTDDAIEPIARNKRARFDYEILDTWECGIVLTGTEVKSLRDGRAQITDAYGIVKDGEVWLLNAHISPYAQGNIWNHDPVRTRKLLLNAKEIRELIGAVERKGLTLVALDLYFKHGRAKLKLGLARGKKLHDKRADIKAKDDAREVARAMRSAR
jgi:SsrA-binding protein